MDSSNTSIGPAEHWKYQDSKLLGEFLKKYFTKFWTMSSVNYMNLIHLANSLIIFIVSAHTLSYTNTIIMKCSAD